MKKLMLTVAACAAMALGAKADISVDALTKDLPEGWGYAIPDLGEKGDEVALVFTNTQNQTTWTAPMLLAKVEYLVVGGGGSGGASGNAYGGGGGGAGQVLNDTLLAVAEGTDFVIDVGAGGAGFGAQSKQGNDGVRSQFAMGGGASRSRLCRVRVAARGRRMVRVDPTMPVAAAVAAGTQARATSMVAPAWFQKAARLMDSVALVAAVPVAMVRTTGRAMAERVLAVLA